MYVVYDYDNNVFLPQIYVFHNGLSSYHKSFCKDFHLTRKQTWNFPSHNPCCSIYDNKYELDA